jgi:hypothetical protein
MGPSSGLQGMDVSMFQGDHFINNNGELIDKEDIITTEVRNGREVTAVITPRVVSTVRKHLQCSSLVGAELEDDGGDGSAGSHWEQRLFEGMQTIRRSAVISSLCVCLLHPHRHVFCFTPPHCTRKLQRWLELDRKEHQISWSAFIVPVVQFPFNTIQNPFHKACPVLSYNVQNRIHGNSPSSRTGIRWSKSVFAQHVDAVKLKNVLWVSAGPSAGELMDAVGGSNTFAGRHALSELTLSLLEDSGWYVSSLTSHFYAGASSSDLLLWAHGSASLWHNRRLTTRRSTLFIVWC